MDIEFDFKGDPLGGVITKCKFTCLLLIKIIAVVVLSFSCLVIVGNRFFQFEPRPVVRLML